MCFCPFVQFQETTNTACEQWQTHIVIATYAIMIRILWNDVGTLYVEKKCHCIFLWNDMKSSLCISQDIWFWCTETDRSQSEKVHWRHSPWQCVRAVELCSNMTRCATVFLGPEYVSLYSVITQLNLLILQVSR